MHRWSFNTLASHTKMNAVWFHLHEVTRVVKLISCCFVGVLGLRCAPSKSLCKSLHPGYIRCDCIWRQGLQREDSVKARPLEWAKAIWLVSCDLEAGWTRGHRGCPCGGQCGWGQARATVCKPRRGTSDEIKPTHALILDFKPQDWDKINLSGLSRPVCGVFMMQP